MTKPDDQVLDNFFGGGYYNLILIKSSVLKFKSLKNGSVLKFK
ncbi:MAG: hypothetical protein ACYCSB_09435 [bacterium]